MTTELLQLAIFAAVIVALAAVTRWVPGVSRRRLTRSVRLYAVYVLVVLLTSDRAVMGNRVNPPLLRWLGWVTAGIMTAATVGMLVTL